MTGDVLTGLALLTGVTVLAAAWAWLEHRRTARRRRPDAAAGRLATRTSQRTAEGTHVQYAVDDLEAAGAKVTYTTPRSYDYDKAVAAKRQAERRQAEMRQLAAQQGQAGTVAKFRRRG
jgi:C4-dicarboxylate-specific signal transduction histidine kinase